MPTAEPRPSINRPRMSTLRKLRKFWRIERRWTTGLPAPNLLRRGFFSYKARLYDFAGYDPIFYLNDWEVEMRLGAANPSVPAAQLRNKLFFHLLLTDLGLGGCATPLFGTIADGHFSAMAGEPDLGALLRRHGELVVKPVDGQSGEGIVFLRRPDRMPASGYFVVERKIEAHVYARQIYPACLNTIRIVTLRRRLDEAPFVAGAAHRFGTACSGMVDNFTKGGVAAAVDLSTGRLSAGKSAPGRLPADVHASHPDTRAPIEGVVVPHWDKAMDMALRLAAAVPGLYYVGWDVCIGPHGPLVVEANSGVANPNILQTEKPLLLDRRIREFFRERGVISERKFREIERRLT
jgi:hypothetical protein